MSRLGRLATALCVVVLLGAAVALGLRWVDAASVPVVVVQSALPLAGIATGLVTVVLLAMHRRWAVLALALLLAHGATGLPAVRRATVPASERDLVVVSTNLRYGLGDPGQVMDQVRRADADVVVLVEVTPSALAALEARGLADWPAQTGIPQPGANGLVVRSRLPITPVDWGDGYPGPWAAATGRLTTPAGPLVVRGVHTEAPNLRDATRWRASMRDLEAWTQGRHRDEPVLMAGDFNAGWGHPAFRRAVRGYVDAHRAAAAGWVRTWPTTGRVPAYTQLDHVLVRGLDVVDAGTFRVDRTDHAGVWARLRLR